MNLYKFSSLKKQSASNLVHNCRRNASSNLIQSRWDKDIHSWNWYIKKKKKKRANLFSIPNKIKDCKSRHENLFALFLK